MMSKKSTNILFFLILLLSCGKPKHINIDNAEEYLLAEITEQKRTHSSNGYSIEVSNLPTEYLATKEFKQKNNSSQQEFDDIYNSYGKALYFLLTIKPDAVNRNGDIMMQDVHDYNGYQKRFMELTFDIKNMIVLKFGNKRLKPVLSTVEHGYGITDYRSVMIAFVPESVEEMSDLVTNDNFFIILDDRIFDTGISKFRFSLSAIVEQPLVILKK